MARLHVLMTVDAIGGIWSYAIELARGLTRARVKTTLALLGPEPTTRDIEDVKSVRGLELLHTGAQPEWLARNAREVQDAAMEIAALARRMRCNIVHLNHPALGVVNYAAPVVSVAHSCVSTWWQAVRSGPLPTDFEWRAALTSEGYQSADMLIAPSAAFAQATADAYGFARIPLVVNNGRRFPQRCERRILSAGPFALTAGRLWDDGKNVVILERAARRTHVPILAAGPTEGPNGTSIQLRRVRATGSLEWSELDLWYRTASVFVSTAVYEPFGLAVLEAAQRGCPLILSDIPTFKELWSDVAVFVPPDDDVAIAEAIERITTDASYARQLALAARRRARYYSATRMSQAMVAIYRSALKLPPLQTSEATV